MTIIITLSGAFRYNSHDIVNFDHQKGMGISGIALASFGDILKIRRKPPRLLNIKYLGVILDEKLKFDTQL